MLGFGDQSADGFLHRRRINRGKLRPGSSLNQLGKGASRGDRGGAATHFEASLDRHIILKPNGQPKNISTRRIHDFGHNGGWRQFPDITGVLEMIEQQRSMHL